MATPTSQTLAQGWQYLRSGDAARAEQIARPILLADPRNIDALLLLRNALQPLGRVAESLEHYHNALQIYPTKADLHYDYGIILALQGRLDEAVAALQRVLQLKPYEADVHNNLGNILGLQGKLPEAITHFRQALQLKPTFVDALHKLGLAQLNLGNADADAIDSFQRVIKLKPNFPEAHRDLGIALEKTGRINDAIASYREALRLKPDFAFAHNRLGNALISLGRANDAIASYQEAARLKPDFAEAHNNLCVALAKAQRLDDAAAAAQEALRLNPNYASAHNNLGNVLKDQGRIEEAIASIRRSLQIQPDHPDSNSGLLGTLHYDPQYDPHAIFEEHQRWEQLCARPLLPPDHSFPNDPSPNRRLRIGYVSCDFRNHVVGRNIWPLLSHHDHTQFDITLYANLPGVDDMTDRFRQSADHWCPIAGWSDDRVAAKILEDRIDILVDLTLHTMGNRLLVFARKPAPLQVTFAGYPGTTGLHAIDYRLTDPHLDPPGLFDQCYAEQSLRLPHTFWCFDPQTEDPPVGPLPAIQNGFLTFGCLNNFCKINPSILDLWAKVLSAVKGSQLLLLADPGSHRQRTTDFLVQRGVAAQQVKFCPRCPRPEYLALYHQIDIGLDTLPYNGHTTSLDSFWMGVPVITLVGNTVVGRGGLSQLTNLNLAHLAASTPEQFVSLAADLAANLPQLQALRSGLRQRMKDSPLMDAVAFTRGIESAYHSMWQKWCVR